MQEFVRQIQRYRSTYVTAIFLSVGWVLGQMLGAATGSGTGATPPVRPDTLDQLRQRPDIAVVLCVIPLVNVLFSMLMLEANAHIQSLARYRFLLGIELGAGSPAWRWEIWKTTREGSIRAWTNPLNVFFTLVAVTLTAAALWFSLPAAWNSRALWYMWLSSLVISSGAARGCRHRRAAAASCQQGGRSSCRHMVATAYQTASGWILTPFT
jgi:hypothetical protein